jgi:hypothetical protein
MMTFWLHIVDEVFCHFVCRIKGWRHEGVILGLIARLPELHLDWRRGNAIHQ